MLVDWEALLGSRLSVAVCVASWPSGGREPTSCWGLLHEPLVPALGFLIGVRSMGPHLHMVHGVVEEWFLKIPPTECHKKHCGNPL